MRVTDIDWPCQAGEQQPQCSFDQVVDMAYRPCLIPIAVNSEGHTSKCLGDEGRNRPTVVGPHPRAVGVENTHNGGIDTVLLPI